MRKHRSKFFCFISLLLISNAIVFFISSDRRQTHRSATTFLKGQSHDKENIEIPLAIGGWKGELLPIQGNGRFMYLYKNRSGEEIELFIVFNEGVNFTRPFECLPSVGWRISFKDEVLTPLETRKDKFLTGLTDKGAKINRRLLEKDERKLLVLFWSQIGKEIFSNYYIYRLKAMKNRILGMEAPKMFVRLTLPLKSFEEYEVKRVTKTAIDFWRSIYEEGLRCESLL